jgi:tRNA-2-methylthio-N6-dimethylallyladenosine synthase
MQACGKKLHVETWGCQMNVADSETMIASLSGQYTMTNEAADADLIILNTCHIREKARHKVVSRLGVLKSFKIKNPSLIIAVAGCTAQAEGRKLIESSKGAIDILLGPGRISELPKLLKDFESKKQEKIIATGFPSQLRQEYQTSNLPTDDNLLYYESINGRNEVSRYLNIQQGCNNYCTFCVVPYTRGGEVSRHPDLIVKQAQTFVAKGAKEIVLLGQNVNSYGLDLVENKSLPKSTTGAFVDLLSRVSTEVSGLVSLRFTTSNPHDFTLPLAQLFSSHKVLGKYIHLPVQSGSDNILSLMKRKVTREQYLKKISWLRESVADMAISTDIIVGFPGESESDFEQTLSLVEDCSFAFAYAFKYSPRPKTPAARMKNRVADAVASTRLAKLNQVLNDLTIKANHKEIGSKRAVLFMYESRKEPGFYYGRTEHFRLVKVKSKESLVGKHLRVTITAANKTALSGELISIV